MNILRGKQRFFGLKIKPGLHSGIICRTLFLCKFLIFCFIQSTGQTTIVNYNFNGFRSALSYGNLNPVLASGVTCTASSTELFNSYTGTGSGTLAFTTNPNTNDTTERSLGMANSSGLNIRYFQFALGGTSLNIYSSYKVYFQARRSSTGANTVTLQYSTDGTNYSSAGTGSLTSTGFFQFLFDLTSVTLLNNKPSISFRILASGASSTSGTLRIDNFQVQAIPSGPPCTAPGVQGVLTGFSTATPIPPGEADVIFNRGNGSGGALIIASTSSSLSALPVNGNSYAANTLFGAGTPLGGGFVVFSGAAGGPSSFANSIRVTGLNANTTYYFYLYEFNGSGPTACFNFPGSTGPVTTPGPPVSSTHFYRSRASGSWNNKNNWETSSDSLTNWTIAVLPPDTTARRIVISAADSIDIGFSVNADQVIVNGLLTHSAGVLRLFNGNGVDLDVSSTGRFKIQTPVGAAFSFGESLIITGAQIRIANSGRITIGGGAAVGTGFENLALLPSSSVAWSNNSVFEWNSPTLFEMENVVYFPSADSVTIPVFRLNAPLSPGVDSASAWNGVFEANAGVSFQGLGPKTFRNGLTGSGNVSKAPSSGRFFISGRTALLGGTGTIALNSSLLPDTLSVTADTTNLISNKTITGGTVVISKVFNAGLFTMGGDATTGLAISGTFNTDNPEGFHESATSSVSNNVPGSRISFPQNPVTTQFGTVDHRSAGTQRISAIADGAGSTAYGNLSSTGGGPRILSNTRIIKVERAFTPGTSSYTVTGSAMEFMGPSGQSIPSFTFNSLIISSATNRSISGNITILDSLKVNAGSGISIGAGREVILRSTDTSTARVGIWEGALPFYSNSTARFVIERYIKPGRKWHLLSTPLTTATSTNLNVRSSLMDSGFNRPGIGTIITTNDTTGWSTRGFDGISPGGPSLKRFNSATQSYQGIQNTNGSTSIARLPSDSGGYFLFVRGDRSCLPTNSNTTATVLRSRGRINISIKDVPVPNIGWACVANPYPSAIDFRAVRLSTSTSAPIPSLYIWDPQLAGNYSLGGFVTYTYNSTTNQYEGISSPSFGSISNRIESGQAFFINLPDASAVRTIQFTEACKTSGSRNVYRPSLGSLPDKIRIDLKFNGDSSGEPVLFDGCLIYFDAAHNDGIDWFDAPKLFNSGENLSVWKDSGFLAIEKRKPVNVGDTIQLNIRSLRFSYYFLEIDATSWRLDNSLRAFIYDRYKQESTPLPVGEITRFGFSVDASAESRSVNRFSIVFRRPGLALGNGSVRPPLRKDNEQYEEEKMAETASVLSVFPNPVEDDYFRISSTDNRSGFYLANIINASGHLYRSVYLCFAEGRARVTVPELPGGFYLIVIPSAAGTHRESVGFIKR